MAKNIEKNDKNLKEDTEDKIKKEKQENRKIFNKDNILICICLILIASVYFSYQFDLISSFKSLPSPLYGGDYYHQLGAVTHVYLGGDPTQGTTEPPVLDARPGYFILYSFLVGNFAKIFSFEPINGMFYFSFVIMILSILVYYYFSYIILKNRYTSLVSTLLYIPLIYLPILKYTQFTHHLIMPMFFIALYLFLKNTNYKNSVLLAVIMGLASISHSTAFPAVYTVFFITLLYFSGFIYLKRETEILESKNKKGVKIKPKESVSLSAVLPIFDIEKLRLFIKNNFKYVATVFVISFVIAQLYWFDPIFVHHAQTQPHYLEWTSAFYDNPSYQSGYLFSVIKEKFFNVSSMLAGILSILTIAGVISIIISQKTFEIKYFIATLIAGFIGTFDYFFTIPILNIQFVPDYTLYMLLEPLIPILIGVGLLFVVSKIKSIAEYSSIVFILVAVVILVNNVNSFESYIKEDKWINAGKNPLPEQFVDLKKFTFENTNVNDVFLTTNEVGFALNALTGAKLVTSRRAQIYPFIEIDDRIIASAIILYGNDTGKKLELIKKYKIKYLYWDYYWIQSEYYFDQQGKMVGWFDPLLVFDTEENINPLKKYNVSYFKEHTWVDPALKADYYKKFDLIFVSPQNYQSFSHPWKSDLDPYLEEVWSYSQGGQKIAVLYKFNV